MSNKDESSFCLSFMNQPGVNDHEREKANRALIYDRYKDRFLSLPKEVGWVTENLYMYQGFWHQTKNLITLENGMAAQETFQAQPTDIYLATLPKSGTTWIKALTFAIINRSRYKCNPTLSTDHPLKILNPHKCVPFVENEVIKDTPTYDVTHSPRLFATHMSYTSLPQSILDFNCRLVYVCRNPKDVLVSLFYFSNKLRDKSLGLMTFDEAFEMFTKGVISKGPYWDHVKGYHKVSLEHPGKVLFLTYENMKRDTKNIVKRLAEFMGCPFTNEEEAIGEMEEIVKLCSFENLSEINKHGYMREGVPNHVFFREGKVGDWTNHLTNEMSEHLDQINKEKFHGLDISF